MCGPIIMLMGGLDSQFEYRHVGSNHHANGVLNSQFEYRHVGSNHHVNGRFRLTV